MAQLFFSEKPYLEFCFKISKVMAYKKIDKEFCLTDNSVNSYGYRLLTQGLALERFAPSIGFFMHDRDKGVAVKWGDFRTEEDKLYAKPSVNESKFPDLAEQIEEGFYQAASVGFIVALATSDKAEDKLPGQTGPTVTKWFPRECSIVDIPGNYNALAMLYDERNNVLMDLSANDSNQNLNENKMNLKDLSAGTLSLLNLKADFSAEDLQTAISGLAAKAGTVDALTKELSDLKAAQTSDKIEAVISKGLADRKLTKATAEALKVDYKENPDGLKKLIDALPAQAMVTEKFEGDVPEKYKGKTYKDLFMSGELEG